MSSIYKVGDKVKIREDLKTGTCGCNTVVDEMLKHAGKTATILEAIQNKCITHYPKSLDWTDYRIDIDNWAWTAEMFEKETINYSEFILNGGYNGI